MAKIKKWQLLNEEDVSPSKWFPLYKHKVKLPNGKVVDDYYVSKLGDVAIIIAITKNNEMIFVRQYKHGANEVLVELPAGMVDGRDPKEAAKEELLEETGFKVNTLEYLGFNYKNPTKDGGKLHGFLTKNIDVENQMAQNLEETEDIEILLVPLKEVEDLIKNHTIKVSDTIAMIHLVKQQVPELFE